MVSLSQCLYSLVKQLETSANVVAAVALLPVWHISDGSAGVLLFSPLAPETWSATEQAFSLEGTE